MSARESFAVACIDDRAKTLINIIPAYGDDMPVVDNVGDSFAFAKETIHAENIQGLPHTTTDQMPVV